MARGAAMYLSRTYAGHSLNDIANYFGLASYGSASGQLQRLAEKKLKYYKYRRAPLPPTIKIANDIYHRQAGTGRLWIYELTSPPASQKRSITIFFAAHCMAVRTFVNSLLFPQSSVRITFCINFVDLGASTQPNAGSTSPVILHNRKCARRLLSSVARRNSL